MPFPFPNEPTLREIAHEWARCSGAPDADTIFGRLIAGIWKGEFVRRTEAGDSSVLFTFQRPNRPGVGYLGNPDGILYEYRKDDPNQLDPMEEMEVVTSRRDRLTWDRELLCTAIQLADPATFSPFIGSDAFPELARFPLQGYRKVPRGYFERLRIEIQDLAIWFEMAPPDWPRPKWMLQSADVVATWGAESGSAPADEVALAPPSADRSEQSVSTRSRRGPKPVRTDATKDGILRLLKDGKMTLMDVKEWKDIAGAAHFGVNRETFRKAHALALSEFVGVSNSDK